jgi:sugar O-acyltransferase (sialic acid O-acetyltransferase NeuD family)
MENPVLIFGAGALGKQALDIFLRNGVLVYGILDDNKELHGTEIADISVLGDTDDGGFLKVIGSKCEAFVAIGERTVHAQLVEMLKGRRKTMPVNAIHDTAVVSALATIGHGNLIAARATLAAGSTVGHHNVIQTGAIIESNVTVGDFVTIGAGAIVNANAQLEDNTFIGPGAIIVSGIKIGKNAQIGAGSVVIADVPAGNRVFGNPAQKM